ncbi:MAG: protein kinase [Gemmatimonadetes bacterium]|nr:protein kinase [Gemmatimonadota bacterium]
MSDVLDRLTTALAERYRVEREIGAGGMATVYLAEDLKHHRQVALKVLKREIAAMVGPERFLREIEIAARLQHPHILPLHDSGDADGLLYYVMPYVEGESLRSRLNREQQLPLRDALQIACEVADALSYAHSHDVLHRDIKPENILLSGEHAIVLDFGIARAISQAGAERITGTGLTVGTPAYMSPEQAGGEAHLDGRSDIYSLGCVLYEMLGGEPPFRGPTPQAVLARQATEQPLSLQVIRPAIPDRLQAVVSTALAKVPADRYSTALQFNEALSTSLRPSAVRRRWSRPAQLWVAAAAVTGIAVAVFASRVGFEASNPLDSNRIVVFPPVVSPRVTGGAGLGEDVASIIVAEVDGAGPLRGIDGWRLLDRATRNDIRLLTSAAATATAEARRAAFYIDGRILPDGDSVVVLLRLHNVSGDSTVAQATASAEVAARAALEAAGQLLLALFPTGGPVDRSSVSRHPLAAIFEWTLGEREYRRAHFAEAAEHFRSAVDVDSTFALAALRGAQASSWIRDKAAALRAAHAALEHVTLLAPRYAPFARGLRAYLSAKADSAVIYLDSALAYKPDWPDALMALGEVYYHFLPEASPLDSLAEAAFTEVHRLDPEFSPVLYHLLQIALRKGELSTAERLMQQFRRTNPDSLVLVGIELMLTCVRAGPRDIDWAEASHQNPRFLNEAALALTVGGLRRPACAEGAWSALLELDTSSAGDWRYGARVGLHNVLVATGRYAEAKQPLDSEATLGPDWLGFWYIVDALAGTDFHDEAEVAARTINEAHESGARLPSFLLWCLGSWYARTGQLDRAEALRATIARRSANGDARQTALLVTSLEARLAVAAHDTTRAIRLLAALTPTANRQELTWDPWESLGWERLTLARLLLERGHPREALVTASIFDAFSPMIYPIYLPASLELRARAAEELGDSQSAARYRKRLSQFVADDI